METQANQSLLSTFFAADFTIQLVMLGLIFCSFWSWTIIFQKFALMRGLSRSADKFEENFWSGKSLERIREDIGKYPKDPFSVVFVTAMHELTSSTKSINGTFSLSQRLDRIMGVTVGREMERIEKHLGFLATVGSTAPFIGLFGTVWGIMNSFRAIGLEKNTSLAVVAPGIAEALFATALGLIAAIPAVVAYNKLSSDMSRYGNRLDSFAQEFSAITSRQLDEAA